MAAGSSGGVVAALNAQSVRLIGASILAGSTIVSAASVATEAGLAIPADATATAAEYVGESGLLPDLVGFALAHPVYLLAAFVGLTLLVLGDRTPLT